MAGRFAPDLEDTPTLEIPDFRRKAQTVLHLMIGADISAEEYLEKLEIIEAAFKSVYQEAVALTQAQNTYHIYQLERQLVRTTRRPAKTDPGLGAVTIPPPALLPDLDIDWSQYDHPPEDSEE